MVLIFNDGSGNLVLNGLIIATDKFLYSALDVYWTVHTASFRRITASDNKHWAVSAQVLKSRSGVMYSWLWLPVEKNFDYPSQPNGCPK